MSSFSLTRIFGVDLRIFLPKRWIAAGLALLGAIVAVLLAHPSQAFSVQVMPLQPELGDTISVIVPSPDGTAPSVTLNGTNYESFDLGQGRFRTLIPTTPLDKPGILSLEIQKGADKQIVKLPLKNRYFPTQHIWLPPGQDGNISDWEYDRVEAFKKVVSPEKFWHGPFLRPNNGPVTSVYGIRRYYNGEFAEDYYHRGVDYAGAPGSAIIAPADGRVAMVGYEKDGFKVNGNFVGLDHGQGVTSIYLHMSRILVKQGDFVKAGQKIGTLGSSGEATGPNLHWGLYVHGKAIDPVPWREAGIE